MTSINKVIMRKKKKEAQKYKDKEIKFAIKVVKKKE